MHGDILAPGKRADYQRAIAAEAAARAKADIAPRGLAATVVQDYYGLLAAQRKYANAQLSLKEARGRSRQGLKNRGKRRSAARTCNAMWP